MNKLTGKLNDVDIKLKNLEIGKVLDVPDLNEEEIESIHRLYGDNYHIMDHIPDSKNHGKYVLGILKYSEIISEINKLNNKNA